LSGEQRGRMIVGGRDVRLWTKASSSDKVGRMIGAEIGLD